MRFIDGMPNNARACALIQGKGTNYDTNKALDWIAALRTNPGTAALSQELYDAANVIKNLQTAKKKSKKYKNLYCQLSALDRMQNI